MITRIFKYNTNFQLIVILLTAVLLWLPAFLNGYPMFEPFDLSYGYNFVYYHLENMPFLYTIIAFTLLMVEAILLNNILAEYKITPKTSYMTAFLYILLMSSTPVMLTLHPFLISNGFIILLLTMLLRIKTKEESYKEIFICGLFAGISSLFYFKSAGLILIVWIFLLIFHTFSWREWIISVIGLATVYIYLFTYFLLSDQLSMVVYQYRNVFNVFNLGRYSLSFSVFQYITSAIIGMLLLVSFTKMFVISREKIIYVRKVFNVIFWLFLLNSLSMLFLITNFIYEFSYLLLPITILTSYYYLSLKKVLFGEIMMWLLITSIVLQKIFIA